MFASLLRSVAARPLLRTATIELSAPRSLSRMCLARRSVSNLVQGTENIFAPPEFEQYKMRPADEGNISNKAFSYFVVGTAGFTYAIAAKGAVTDVLHTMNPSADVLALANIEVDLSAIPEGESVTLKWRGKPLFVRHRTAEEIASAEADDALDMRDPQADSVRVKNPEWLVLLGVCTHLGCVPLNYQGDYHGFFCPCHGSHYDTSGRIRKGPAPLNLEVPPYAFIDDTKMIVGTDSV